MKTTECFLKLIRLFGLFCNIHPRHSYQDDFGPYLKDGSEFDFIVVGGGSAGSVVASRLSEHPTWRVLLVEAGGYPTVNSEIPITSVTFHEQHLDWNYKTEPVNTTCQRSEGRCSWPMGKGLGGTSTINGMIYARGHEEDYNAWERMGNTGWGWEGVLPYFKKSQNAVGREGEDLGKGGPLTTTYYRSPNIMRDVYFQSAKEDGIPTHDGEEAIGVFELFNTIENGTRCSAGKAFLAKNKDKRNLYVAINTRATKILTTDNRATGVEVYTGGKFIRLVAKNEVIVSSGSTHSPHLLMLSGIGPQQHLTDLGIPVVADLPVGKNLQDHLMMVGIYARMDALNQTTNLIGNTIKYCTQRHGRFGNIDLLNIAWFLSTNNSQYPDVQIVRVYTPKSSDSKEFECTNLDDSAPANVKAASTDYDVINLVPVLVTPKSKGEIRLASKEPFTKPLIFPNYLEDENDATTILKSIGYIKRMLKTPAFAQYNAQLLDPELPQCASVDFDTEEYWRCVLRYAGMGAYHGVGTCKMGPDPKEAVVDVRLRVHGVENLRVVDAGVMAKIISRNTNAATIMIGEKASDMIKEDWNLVPN